MPAEMKNCLATMVYECLFDTVYSLTEAASTILLHAVRQDARVQVDVWVYQPLLDLDQRPLEDATTNSHHLLIRVWIRSFLHHTDG